MGSNKGSKFHIDRSICREELSLHSFYTVFVLQRLMYRSWRLGYGKTPDFGSSGKILLQIGLGTDNVSIFWLWLQSYFLTPFGFDHG